VGVGVETSDGDSTAGATEGSIDSSTTATEGAWLLSATSAGKVSLPVSPK